jgi:hypothetical protein
MISSSLSSISPSTAAAASSSASSCARLPGSRRASLSSIGWPMSTPLKTACFCAGSKPNRFISRSRKSRSASVTAASAMSNCATIWQ